MAYAMRRNQLRGTFSPRDDFFCDLPDANNGDPAPGEWAGIVPAPAEHDVARLPALDRGFREGTIRAKRSSGLGPSRELTLEPSWNSTKAQIRSHIFRIWTACAVLAVYVYGWFYTPEVLTWWKRTTTWIIEAGCNLLPYPWGDRIEATLGNFGLWVQITLAIIVFRILVWLVTVAVRRPRGGRGPPPERPQSLRVEGPE
jgi:hypothetical protein